MIRSIIILFLIIFLFSNCSHNKPTNQPVVNLLYSSKSLLGEGAIWDAQFDRLFWVDIEGKKLNIFNLNTKINTEHDMPARIGTVVVVDSISVLVALEDGIYSYSLDSRVFTKRADPEPSFITNRFNDGKCDPAGRFWVGTMSLINQKRSGALYMVDSVFNVTKKIDSVSISNGIVWSLDKKYMYYIDTPTGKVMQYAYNELTGSISNPKIAIIIPDSIGKPDGSTIDENGNIWIALWGGSAVSCWDPATGKMLQKIEVPAKNVTSCAFGGANLDQLFITTAKVGMNEADEITYPEAGSLFVVTTGIKGVKAFSFRSAFTELIK